MFKTIAATAVLLVAPATNAQQRPATARALVPPTCNELRASTAASGTRMAGFGGAFVLSGVSAMLGGALYLAADSPDAEIEPSKAPGIGMLLGGVLFGVIGIALTSSGGSRVQEAMLTDCTAQSAMLAPPIAPPTPPPVVVPAPAPAAAPPQ